MTVDEAVELVLRRLGADKVNALAVVVGRHADAPAALPGVLDGGTPSAADAVAALLAAWGHTPGLTGEGVALALRVSLAARERAEASRAHPVWTGPGAKGRQRLTAATLHELIAGSRERILVVSFAAHTLGSVARDLSAAVARGVEVDVRSRAPTTVPGPTRPAPMSRSARSTGSGAGVGRASSATLVRCCTPRRS